MPRTDWGWQITPEELAGWILREDSELLVVNKPGAVVCHPSKYGPWSSLIGACREYLGADVLHMPSRLDRETSGVVVFARRRELGSRLQRAIQHGQVNKTYLAILCGQLDGPLTVDQPIGRAGTSPVFIKQAVREGGQPAVTDFVPLEQRAGYTLARIHPHSGRLHQIRVHAAHIGHAVAADKLYGPDDTLFLEFISHGFSARLAEALPLPRQALHAVRLEFRLDDMLLSFEAPLAADLAAFWAGLA